MADWKRVPAGSVSTQRKDRVTLEPGMEYRAMGVRWYGKGAYDRGVVTTETVKAKSLFRACRGDFVFNRIDTQKGAFDVVPPHLDGALATNEFPLYVTDTSRLFAPFLLLYFQQEAVKTAIARTRAGSEGRARWKEADFEAWQIPLPSLAEQRRIVDLIETLDLKVSALLAEKLAAQSLLSAVLAEAFEGLDGQAVSIEDLCSHVVGGIWGQPEGEGEVDRLALGPRIYAPGTSGFVLVGSPVRSMKAAQAARRTVQENDIILERSGGSPEQPVGRVAIAGPGLAACVPTDFQRLLRPDLQRVNPKYLFWKLRNDWATGVTRNYSRRTTGITNLSMREYIAREITLPSQEQQTETVNLADAIDDLIASLNAEVTALLEARNAMLEGLMSQEIKVEEAYDSFPEEVA